METLWTGVKAPVSAKPALIKCAGLLASGQSVQSFKWQEPVFCFFFILTSIHFCSCVLNRTSEVQTLFSTIKYVNSYICAKWFRHYSPISHCLVMHSVVALEIFKMTFVCLCVSVHIFLFFFYAYVCLTYVCVWELTHYSFIIVKKKNRDFQKDHQTLGCPEK